MVTLLLAALITPVGELSMVGEAMECGRRLLPWRSVPSTPPKRVPVANGPPRATTAPVVSACGMDAHGVVME